MGDNKKRFFFPQYINGNRLYNGNEPEKLDISQQCPGSRRNSPVLRCIRCRITSQEREGIFLLCSTLVWPHLKCCVQFGVSQYKKNTKLFEVVQRRATEMVKALEGRLYEVWLFSVCSAWRRGD